MSPGGHIIASVPITPTKDGNPHHLHDFTKNSFLTMFKNIKCNQAESFEQIQHWFSKQPKPKHKDAKKNAGNKKIKMVIKIYFSTICAILLILLTDALQLLIMASVTSI